MTGEQHPAQTDPFFHFVEISVQFCAIVVATNIGRADFLERHAVGDRGGTT